jgi:hypothetical protein
MPLCRPRCCNALFGLETLHVPDAVNRRAIAPPVRDSVGIIGDGLAADN